jgi:two-component system, OmpR family, manganese sensing sensor histidine kinase
VPLDALLMETIEEQQLAATARGINLTLEIVDPIVPAEQKDLDAFSILGDWDRLARLFTNLLTNAIQYTPPQLDAHSSSLTMGRSEIKVQLKQIFRQNSAYLQVKVSDTGIGIPDTALPHLFDRFYRVDPARTATASDVSSGSGLGLAIVQSIVASHQGELSIESEVNVGTTVTTIFKAVVMRA